MGFDHELAAKQDNAIQRMLLPESDGGALLAFDMGLGKTRTGCMFARQYGAKVVLAVVPLQTIEDWEATAEREYPGMPVRVINSTGPGTSALAAFQWRTPGIYLITHQYWESKAWVKTLVPKRRKSDPDKWRKVDSGVWGGINYLLIFDESHRAANTQSWTFKALMNLTPFYEGGPFKLSMSGTFMGDRFDGAYGATKWIWPHRTDILPKDIFEWRGKWAEIKYDKFAPRNQKVVGELVEGAFVSALPCYIREESNMPDPVVHDLEIDLYPEQRRVYDDLDERMVSWINDNPLIAEYSITKRARQRQTTLAMPTIEFNEETGDAEVWFEDDAISAKIDQLFLEMEGKGELGDLIVGEKLLILTDSQLFARLLTLRLNERYGDVAREWSGKVTKPRRKVVKQEFVDGDVQHIVGVQAAMGTGTDGLQYSGARTVIFMSKADRRIDNEQGISRLNRTGQTRIVHVINFVGVNTVDAGQISKQMAEALRRSKEMKAIYRREERERQANERRQKLQGIRQHE